MAKLRIAVLGASKMGKFHVREFANAGADIVAILGSSDETATQTAKALLSEFGVHPKAYTDLGELIDREDINAVSICTPPAMHYAQIKKSLEAGLHVFCEKPFVFDSYADNCRKVEGLVKLSEERGVILTVNTQWPAILDNLEGKVDFSKLKSFSMQMQPRSVGLEMLIEQLSHTNSLVVKLIPGGYAEQIKFFKNSPKEIAISFVYKNKHLKCNVTYIFTHKVDRPRKVAFVFNGVEWRREVGENYEQRLVAGKTVLNITDPLRVSVGRFVGAISGQKIPLVSTKEIVENMVLQDRFIAEYMKL